MGSWRSHTGIRRRRRTGPAIDLYLAVGGGSRSPLWCQIIADATRRTVIACREVETTALGAGMQAAAGWFDSIPDAAEAMSGERARYEPDERRAERYGKLLEVYREIYPRVKELFPVLSAAVEDNDG